MNIEKYRDKFDPEVFKHLQEIIEKDSEIEKENNDFVQIFSFAYSVDPSINLDQFKKQWNQPGSVIKLKNISQALRGSHKQQRPTQFIVDDPEDTTQKTTGFS